MTRKNNDLIETRGWWSRGAGLLSGMALATAMAVMPASAQDYPDKTVTLVVPYNPGGATDTIGRIVADGLAKVWDQSVVVENKPGAGSNIGAAYVAHQPADGYTLLVATDPALVLNQWVYDDLPYKASDFDPVTHLINVHSILVVPPSLGVSTLEEFVDLMKKDGSKYNYGSPGVGDGSHIGMEWFKNEAGGFEMTHIPYTGMGPTVQGMLSGDIQALIVSVVTAQQHIEAGKMIPLAVSGSVRSPMLPDVPTFAEQGYPTIRLGFSAGLLAPAGTPLEVRTKIADAAREALSDPAFREKFVDGFGYEVVSSSPDEFAEFLKTESEVARKKVELAGAKKN